MNLSLAFITGMLAAVNPCGFILLPTYLLYFLGLSAGEAGVQRAPITRALAVSLAVSAGFISVFAIVGLITEFATTWFNANAKYLTGTIGLVLVVLGVALLFGYRLPITTPKLDAGGRDRTIWSMFVYGVAYAIASIGCTLPLFMVNLFGGARREGFFAGVANIAMYGLGMALLVTALTVTLAAANVGLLKVLRRGMQYVEMLAGAFVLLSGAYLLWYFWIVDVREDRDPITRAVDRYQSDVAQFLNDNWRGVATALAAVVAAAVVWVVGSRREAARTRSTAPSSK
ncbi:MAG: cytochrome c biogenesis CcdA family protein [Ilumatobacteraceae bacterium]